MPTQELHGPSPAPGHDARLIARALSPLRESPVVLPALGTLALFVAWATDDGGYAVTHWAPGGIVVLVLLAVAVIALGFRPRELPRAVLIALACLAAYTAWSFLSIIWAADPGAAFEGAARTLLYLIVFMIFATFPLRSRGAALLVTAWVLAITGVGVFVLIHLDGLGASALGEAFSGGRLIYPAGYVNAAAAQWMIAAWPAALLVRSERLPAALRGVLAGAAVLLSSVALLSQSRGATIASAVVLVLVFALLPRRLRTFAVIVPVLLGVAASARPIVKADEHLENGVGTPALLHSAQSALQEATLITLVAAVVVGLVVGLAAAYEGRALLSAQVRGRARRATVALATATLVGVLAGGLAVAGNPVTRVRHAWDTFKSPRGYEANARGNRLLSGLGSNRYDFYRVALDEFGAHPLLGIGSENYAQQYLTRGRSGETPRYPHSLELRTLTETGLVGTLIALVGVVAALLAAARAVRSPDPLAAAVAAAAVTGFAYWLVHGSADWFWEYAGLGAPAFALLGIACALDPSRRVDSASPAREIGSRRRLLTGSALALAGLAGAAAFALPWFSSLEVGSAAAVWARAPATAYSRLRTAADIDPLSAEPYLLAGSIALRYGELSRADRDFELALERSPDDQYATLERGAIASQRGNSVRADALLSHALVLYPRDPLARDALAISRAGGRVSVAALNESILNKAQQLE